MQPSASFAIDLIHTMCFGSIQRLISAILWRIILSNCYRARGGKETQIETNLKHVREALFLWYEQEDVSWGNRLSDLTASMLGGVPSTEDDSANSSFGGGHMRLKAHETLCILPFAIDLLRKHPTVHCQAHLMKAGTAMIELLELLRKQPMRVESDKIQHIFDLMHGHLMRCEWAQLAFVPKHHFAAHLVKRTGFFSSVALG